MKGMEAELNREELEQERKKIISNMVLFLAAFFVILIAVGTMAWFASNRDVEGNGMRVEAQGIPFEISTLENGSNGAFYDPYHTTIRNDIGSSALVWQVTGDENMGNFGENAAGIHPGSSGQISFYLTPRVDSVNVDFTFELIGYRAEESVKTDETEGSDISMTPYTAASEVDADKEIANYLNGHILLFENKTTDGDKEYYTGLIKSDGDMKRVLENKNFTGNGTKTKVTIYWVWPRTLSTLIDARSCTLMDITQEPFTQETDATRQEILKHILEYPQYYLKDVGKAADVNQNTLVERYDIYGDLYDRVDNNIGRAVDYVYLKLSVSEHTTGE